MHISVKDIGIASLYPSLCRIGFDGVDVSFPSHEMRDAILSEKFENTMMERYDRITEAGLSVAQTHLSYCPAHLPMIGDGGYRNFEAYMLPILTKEIALVSKMNCRTAVIHLYYEPSKEGTQSANLRLIEKLLPDLEKYGVTLCIENIYGARYEDVHLTTAEDLLFYTDHFHSDFFGVCLDTGHAMAMRQNPIEMAKNFGPALKALHLHSSVSGRDLHLPPYLAGNVDWTELCRVLKKIGYGGSFNMELNPPRQLSVTALSAYYTMAYAIAKDLLSDKTN